MKALTICQPYAELIARGVKRVENRTWPTRYRGTLLIHAGRSRDWLALDDTGTMDREHLVLVSQMRFGAIIAQCRLLDCVRKDDASVWRKYPWLHEHPHAIGPWCWILDDVRRWDRPVDWRGAQGLFEIQETELAAAQAAARLEEPPERIPGGRWVSR